MEHAHLPWSNVHTGVQQLRVKIQKQMAIREQKARRKNLTKYIPNAAAAIFTVPNFQAPACCCTSKQRKACPQLYISDLSAGGICAKITASSGTTSGAASAE